MPLIDQQDLFLLEKGKHIVIRQNGSEVGPSQEMVNAIAPALATALAGKNYLTYEPDRYLWIDDVAGVSISEENPDLFVAALEAAGADTLRDTIVTEAFGKIADFQAALDDPQWGWTQEQIDDYNALQAKVAEAEAEMAASPITGITYAQAEAYIDANVTDAGTAKAMKKMARLLLAMAKRMDWSE